MSMVNSIVSSHLQAKAALSQTRIQAAIARRAMQEERAAGTTFLHLLQRTNQALEATGIKSSEQGLGQYINEYA